MLFGHHPLSFRVRCLFNGTVHFYDCTRFVAKLHLDIALLSMYVNYAHLCHPYQISMDAFLIVMTHNETIRLLTMFIDKIAKANEIRFRIRLFHVNDVDDSF